MGEFDTTIGYMLVSVLRMSRPCCSSLDDTLSYAVNTFFGGIIASQFSTYHNSSTLSPPSIPYTSVESLYLGFNDPPWVKLGVVALYLMNAAHIVSMALMAWTYCVAWVVSSCFSSYIVELLAAIPRDFNHPELIDQIDWTMTLCASMTAVLALINQTFQSHRIYRFIGNKWLMAFLAVGILADCALGVAAAIQATIVTTLDKVDNLRGPVEGNLALQATLDIIVSIILSARFYQSKTRIHAVSFAQSKSRLRRTNKGLNMLMRAAIQSGIFTSLFAIGSLLAYRYAPGTYMNLIFSVPIGRIYTHTILDHLISREHLRHILTTDGSTRTRPRPAVATTNRNVPQSTVVFNTLGATDMMSGHDTSGSGTGSGADSLQVHNDKDKDPEAQLELEVHEMHSRKGRERTHAEP
ncbi:hypothetical protein FB45DRAFT_929580 [Roridomyces roridus]|uniref:DUF6534 domain-containing protein n=1 Tax=Roridomyces roridus TaxID=1738132 RepID=A0AAD7FEZ0_9AGAR|nr:hypothetical protein FB45DRAFT_929580 [Roridomyces roridus]